MEQRTFDIEGGFERKKIEMMIEKEMVDEMR